MQQFCHLTGLGPRTPVLPDIFAKKARVVVRVEEFEDPVDHVDVDPDDGLASAGGTSALAVVMSDRDALGLAAEQELRVLWAGELDPVAVWLAACDAISQHPDVPAAVATTIARAARELRAKGIR